MKTLNEIIEKVTCNGMRELTEERCRSIAQDYAALRVKEEIEILVRVAYGANNHARRLLNTHDSSNGRERELIDERAEYLAANYGNDNDEPKIVQS